MSLLTLVRREIRHRKMNFLLSAFGVAVAVFCVLWVLSMLRSHDRESDEIIAKMEAETATEMKKLEDEIRKSMKGLGFNIFIFPKDQDMSEVYAQGYASKTMPEEYVEKLANSKIITVNHLLPTLTQKLKWPERERTIILIGVRGEVPLAHRDPKAPLIEPVEPGKIVMGYELHKSLSISAGDSVPLLGQTFEVSECYTERGTADDITVWMNLGDCQKLLEKPGEINAIQALECNCATVDRLGEIRAELLKILPDTQITETGSSAIARAEARNQAKATAQKQIAAAKKDRAKLGEARRRFSSMLLPGVTVFSMILVALLALLNVRDRISEIGILQAVGVNGGTVQAAFLSRSALVGLLGVVGGMIIFVIIFCLSGKSDLFEMVRMEEFVIIVIAAPLLAALAAWLPSVLASENDPAVILQHD